jgi:hypothetical protein
MTKMDSQKPGKTKMKKQTIFLILLLSCQVFAANKPTFINMQTADGIIHYPIIVSVTETDVIIDGQVAIPISSINSVTAYGSVKSILPILAGGCFGCLGVIPSGLIWKKMGGSTAPGNEVSTGALPFILGMGGSAVAGYTTVHKILARRSQQMVFMAPWTFEQKRDFFISALKP